MTAAEYASAVASSMRPITEAQAEAAARILAASTEQVAA